MHRSRFRLFSLFILIGVISFGVIAQEPRPVKAVEGILKVFDRYPLVALGEWHGSRTEHDFILALLQHPAFPNKVNDIVVEFGNAFYQPLMDRYTAGEEVAATEIRQVWRNTGVTSMAWDVPVYERFFATVRAVNKRLPKKKQLRVLLGDPPYDWSRIKSRADVPRIRRDDHFTQVIQQEVLGKKRKALLIAGLYHLFRCCPSSDSSSIVNVTRQLDQSHPGAVFVVLPHDGFDEQNNEALEQRLASWPLPGLAFVKNTWLGKLNPDIIFPASKRGFNLMPDGSKVVPPSPYGGLKIQEITDAYLYLGPKSSLVKETLPPAVLQDVEYQNELKRRRSLPR